MRYYLRIRNNQITQKINVMKTNEETVLENGSKSESLNEETMYGNPGVGNEVYEDAEEQEVEEAAESKRSSWKEVVISGVSGIALGAAGVLFSGFVKPEPVGPTPIPKPTPASAISVATGVNDDMSFNEAFAAARHEVGAHGAFMWHGQVYSTCYAEEWNALSPEEQSAFSENAVAAVTGQPAPVQNHVTTTPDKPEVTENVDHPTGDKPIEVHVLGVEENVVTEGGDVINIGVAQIEGHDALFIDADNNGTFDYVAVDVNDDNNIDIENEVFGVNDPDMNVSAFSNEAPVQSNPSVDDIYAQMPDYTNDADVSSLV